MKSTTKFTEHILVIANKRLINRKVFVKVLFSIDTILRYQLFAVA